MAKFSWDDLIKQAASLGNDYARFMFRGSLATIGAEPIEKRGANTVWRFFHKRFQTGPDIMGLRMMEGDVPLDILTVGMNVMNLGATASVLGLGLYEGGLKGAATRMSMDFAVSAGIVQHGYQQMRQLDGTVKFLQGHIPGIRRLHKLGFGKTAAALGIADMSMRYAWGMAGASTMNALAPGGLMRGPLSAVGAWVGTRYAGTLTLAAAAALPTYLIGRGAYSIAKNTLKAGYNHAQLQKTIQTSGDMAAFHTQGAFTMRARAVQAIQKSHLNARSALGQEASYMHYPSKNYHSIYRMY